MNAPANFPPVHAESRAAFDHAVRLAPAIRRTTAAERIARIRRLMQVLLAHRPEIYESGKLERGLQPPDIDGELLMLKNEADFIATQLADWMTSKVAPPSLFTLGKTCYVQYEPKGVVLVLPSWNAPYVIGLLPTLGAIAAGNTVLLKPSELAPHSSKVVAKIVREAFPDGHVQVVEGGVEAAQGLLACPVNHIFYIGNNTVGRIIMKAAADHFASVTLEMGGKNPSIVDRSADVEDAALKTAWGRVCNAGQACIAPDYVLVHESVAQRYTDALVKEIKALYDSRGTGFENSPDMPRIINARHFERIKSLLDDAREKGATFALGGQTRAEDRFIAPTVLTNVNDSMKIMDEEVFGPVICIVPFRTRDDVLAEIGKRPKPLALYVFAKDRAEIDFYLQNTTSGSSAVNHNVIQSGTNPYCGFGGVNASGIGRMVGWNTFAEASNARTVMEEGPAVMDVRDTFPPLTDKFKKQMTDLLERDKPIPAWIVGIIGALVRFRQKFSKA